MSSAIREPLELGHALRHVQGCVTALRDGDLVLSLAHAKDARSDLYYVAKSLDRSLSASLTEVPPNPSL